MVPSPEILSATAGVAPRPRPRAGGNGQGTASTRCRQHPDDAPRIYVASPLTTYRTPRYDAKLAQIGARFPAATLLPARDLFRSTAEWHEQWPLLLPTLTTLVFFTEIEGTIGLGVWSEVHDAAEGIPVWYLDDAGGWFGLDAVTITVTGDSLSRFAAVEVIDPAEGDAPDPSASRAGGA
jgi:hypothetical protein